MRGGGGGGLVPVLVGVFALPTGRGQAPGPRRRHHDRPLSLRTSPVPY